MLSNEPSPDANGVCPVITITVTATPETTKAQLLLPATGAAFPGFQAWHRCAPTRGSADGEAPIHPRAFVSMVGFGVNLLFVALILLTGMSLAASDPCLYIMMPLP